jgi:hypothetical protein
MSSTKKYQIPKLTSDNYVDWIVKMKSVLKAKELYQLVLGKEPTKVRGKDGKIIDIDQSLCLDKAHALIITQVHSSISGCVRKDGAEDCPIKLWKNILEFGASKKEANVFKAWYRLMHLPLRYNNVSDFISKFWDGLATLQSLDVKIDKNVLGHILLMKIPPQLSHVCNSIIASGTSLSVKVTHETVLEMLDSQIKADTTLLISVPSKPAANTHIDSAEALLTCPQGHHLPNNKSHTSNQCFSLHPELLTEFRKRKKEQEASEAHLTTVTSPSMFNAKANETQSDTVNDLVALFNNLPTNLDNHSDRHKSEASLF